MALLVDYDLNGIPLDGLYLRVQPDTLVQVIEREDPTDPKNEKTIKRFVQHFSYSVFKDKDAPAQIASQLGSLYLDVEKPTLKQIYAWLKENKFPNAKDC